MPQDALALAEVAAHLTGLTVGDGDVQPTKAWTGLQQHHLPDNIIYM